MCFLAAMDACDLVVAISCDYIRAGWWFVFCGACTFSVYCVRTVGTLQSINISTYAFQNSLHDLYRPPGSSKTSGVMLVSCKLCSWVQKYRPLEMLHFKSTRSYLCGLEMWTHLKNIWSSSCTMYHMQCGFCTFCCPKTPHSLRWKPVQVACSSWSYGGDKKQGIAPQLNSVGDGQVVTRHSCTCPRTSPSAQNAGKCQCKGNDK